MLKTIETKRLILREFTLDDVADVYEYAKDERVGPSAGWKPHQSLDESAGIVKMFMESGEVYAIVLKDENKVIGSLGLHKRYPDESLTELNQREIGYVLSPTYWGNGYAPEAVESLKAFAFEELNIEVLWCAHSITNEKSRRVIEKCGFEFKFEKVHTLPRLDNKQDTSRYYWIKNAAQSHKDV